MTTTTEHQFAQFLLEQNCLLNALETDALHALYEKKDEAVYRNLIKERAQMIADLSEKAVLFCKGKDKTEAIDNILHTLENFSSSAKMSLKVDSVFFMSALLYPDEHKKGDPNNLEVLLSSL